MLDMPPIILIIILIIIILIILVLLGVVTVCITRDARHVSGTVITRPFLYGCGARQHWVFGGRHRRRRLWIMLRQLAVILLLLPPPLLILPCHNKPTTSTGLVRNIIS